MGKNWLKTPKMVKIFKRLIENLLKSPVNG